MIYNIFIWKPFLFQLQQYIKHRAKPAILSSISGVLSDLPRSRADLIVEYTLLRQTHRPPSTGETSSTNPR